MAFSSTTLAYLYNTEGVSSAESESSRLHLGIGWGDRTASNCSQLAEDAKRESSSGDDGWWRECRRTAGPEQEKNGNGGTDDWCNARVAGYGRVGGLDRASGGTSLSHLRVALAFGTLSRC